MLSFRGIFTLSLIGAALYVGADQLGFLEDRNDPLVRVFGGQIERRMNKLKDGARLSDEKLPWGDSPWLTSNLGINRAWRLELREEAKRAPSNAIDSSSDGSHEKSQKTPDAIKLPSLKELRALSPDKRRQRIADLPASVKFDLARMNFSFPIYRAESARIFKSNSKVHLLSGWALASTKLKEPAAHTFTVHASPDFKIEVPFFSSDVKSLMAWYLSTRSPKQLNKRVLGYLEGESTDTVLDPASFHVALANFIGKKNRPLILEFGTTNTESRPIVSYDSDIRIESSGHYRVSTTVEYTKLRLPQEDPYGIQNWETDVAVFDYRLEVDSSGKIVRGSWIGDQFPLAIWDASIPKLEPGFELLEEIYKAVP